MVSKRAEIWAFGAPRPSCSRPLMYVESERVLPDRGIADETKPGTTGGPAVPVCHDGGLRGWAWPTSSHLGGVSARALARRRRAGSRDHPS